MIVGVLDFDGIIVGLRENDGETVVGGDEGISLYGVVVGVGDVSFDCCLPRSLGTVVVEELELNLQLHVGL